MIKKNQLSHEVDQIYIKINRQYKIILQNDPSIERQDTCKGIVSILQDLRTILGHVNVLSVEDRAHHYNITYNAVTYILDITNLLRKSNFSYEAIRPLLDSILAMESNIILQDVKYMDKRLKLYLDICHIYQQAECYQAAITLLQNGIQKVKDLKSLHEIDPPLPAHVSIIINNALNILKIMNIKYSIQSGVLSAADWRKKIDEQFGSDLQVKLQCLVECLRTQTRRKSNIFIKASSTGKAFKETLIQSAYDFIKPPLQIITKALNQQKQKIQSEVEFRSNESRTQEIINEQIKRKRTLQQTYVKEKDYKKASEDFPFEFHSELIHYCFEAKNIKLLGELLDAALIRIQCRRIQVPYVNDVAIIASNTPQPNIPNGYQKIPIDLNQANLKNQLKKLRKSGKKDEEAKKEAPVAKVIDAKKGGKDPPPQPISKNKDAPTQWELQQIKHKYVFMILKKSMSPENAVYDMKIVLGDEETGPVGYADARRIIVPYIQQNMKSIQSQVSQYPGVRETTKHIPYIVLYHSQNSLENQVQKRTIITDIKPLVGRNPMIPPIWGYNKIPFDLRQVPAEFIKAPNHDYVFLTYRTDESFNINSSHVQVLYEINQLEKSYPKDKISSIEDQKRIELQVIYDIDKLNSLFMSLQKNLQGPLGEDYYNSKNDFLTQLCFYIWTKYLRGPLLQFQYVMQQKLNEQIIDYDYKFYKNLIDRVKPVFLKGFKIFNSILVNNPKSDVLLLARINLQLAKGLEEAQEYKLAADSVRQCLERLWLFRDQYLSRGLQGLIDKLLPFSISCSNSFIKQTISEMKKTFRQQRRQLKKSERIINRKMKNQPALNQSQLQEQMNQYIKFQKNDEVDDQIQKVNFQHSQLISIVSSVELDLSNIYFRTSLKHADQLKKKSNQTNNNLTNGISNDLIDGLSSSLVQRLHLMTNPNQLNLNKSVQQLQSTLVKVGHLTPPKPNLHKSELRLLQGYQRNPYMMSLLLMNLGAINSGSQQKTYFMKESLNEILKAREIEITMAKDAIQNSIFIFSTLWDHQLTDETSSLKIPPFKQLYQSEFITPTDTPSTPILVSRNSHSVSFKMPPFKSKKSYIKSMSIYGKISANGVDVSLNCNELQGTGLQKPIAKVVKISSLQPHKLYCFAVAGTNSKDELQGIGKTSMDIGTYHPLSIPMLASYLAKVSYQINEYQTAERAAKLVLDQFCQKSGYYTEDEKINNIYLYRFNQAKISLVPLPEIRSIAQALFTLALCYRKNLQIFKENNKQVPILVQSKEKQITNLIILSSFLTPSLSCPLSSLPFLIPDNEIAIKAFGITLIPQKWMSPKLRQLGVRVMRKILKWGVQKNEIGMARRICYRWSERKWLMISKVVQVEQKKQVKKGGKDNKQQQVKLIDKYCRFAVEKSPGMFDSFEESIFSISDQYSDYVNMFVQRAKDQIANLSQYVDNSPEQIQSINNSLTMKVEMLEYLKAPLTSIGKIPASSPFYLEYNCRLFKRAIELASQSQYKAIAAKGQQITLNLKVGQILLGEQIYKLMMQAIQADIAWSPYSKKQLQILQDKTGKDLSKAINIFTNYENKKIDLSRKIGKMSSLLNKFIDYDYLNMWISELYWLKAISFITANIGTFSVPNPIPGRFDQIKFISLEDLLKKKEEIAIRQKNSYLYTEQQKNKIIKILQYLAQSAYAAFSIQNWIKLQNIVKVTMNIITQQLMTPFYHKDSKVWIYLTLISLLSIFMLENIRKKGFDTFKTRYNTKIANTQMANINLKLQIPNQDIEPMVQQFVPQYYQSELSQGTTKAYWFEKQSRIYMEPISSLICYTVQCLRMQVKYNLVINVVRDFCNVTQHFYSLQLLPFMIESQQKLMEEVQKNIQNEKKNEQESYKQYMKEKSSKKKGQRQAQITGQKPTYQIEYQQRSQKIKESLGLLQEQRKFISDQSAASKKIIDEIIRDSSKAVIMQREQRKYIIEFAQAEQHMIKHYGDQDKLAKNRKNVLKDIINRYNDIYEKLKNDKTSKDVLAEIQNRHDVGNLLYASGAIDKAEEHWNDALSTIFKIVDPINQIPTILQQKKPYLVNILGLKQTLLAIVLLYKISKFGAFNRVDVLRKSTDLTCILVKSMFQTDLSYPQNFIQFSNFRLKGLSKDVFTDEATFNLAELLTALEHFAFTSIDQKSSLKALPIVVLMDFISTDIVKSTEISIRSKIIKTIALAESSCISEAIVTLLKVANQKDLPMIWVEMTDVVKKEKGQNWYPETQPYVNHKSWNETENKENIELIKKISLRKQFTKLYGIINPILFKFSVGKILAKIYEIQVCENYELNEIRCQGLNEAEALMRESLKKLAFTEQFYQLLQNFQATKLAFKKNQVSEELKKAVDSSKNKIVEHLKANSVQQQLHSTYFNSQFTSLKRSIILECMCRIRLSIAKIYQSKNMYSNSFFVLKNGIINIQRYSIGVRAVQNGTEPQVKPKTQLNIPAGKKEEKKGGKKQQEAKIEKPIEIDMNKQKDIQLQTQSKKVRTSVSAYWHIRLCFEIGKTMFKLNRFKMAVEILQKMSKQCLNYHEDYFYLIGKGYICRSMLRLGKFSPQDFQNLIKELENKGFYDQEYVSLALDFGEAMQGEKSLIMEKGKKCAQIIWKINNKIYTMEGIGLDSIKRLCSGVAELTPEQEEEVKRKIKKLDPKAGGKDEKKGAKKQDPKKKKDDTKLDFKAQPLCKYEWWNLLDQDKHSFVNNPQQPHPNFHPNNIYSTVPLIYIKCHLRKLGCDILQNIEINENVQIRLLLKLLYIVESYPFSNYSYKITIYRYLGILHKRIFLARITELVSNNKKNNLTLPYQDLPLNSELIKISSYSKFLTENISSLKESILYFKKLVDSIKNSCLFFQNRLSIDEVLWQLSDCLCLLAQCTGRQVPKYFLNQPSNEEIDELTLTKKNTILQAFFYLEMSCKASKAKQELIQNYTEIGSKALDPTAKIDEDVINDIVEMDQIYKSQYPQFLSESIKAKTLPNALDIVTYMIKIYRESQLMTFSNNHLQNILIKCHRILFSYITPFKQKCSITNIDPPIKKDPSVKKNLEQTFIQLDYIGFKGKRTGSIQKFLYVLGPLADTKNESIYGRVNFNANTISHLSEELYILRSKIGISDKKSEVAKKRDYIWHQKDYLSILGKFSLNFDPQIQQLPSDKVPELNYENVSILISIIGVSGIVVKNTQINSMLRYLHGLKYKIAK